MLVNTLEGKIKNVSSSIGLFYSARQSGKKCIRKETFWGARWSACIKRDPELEVGHNTRWLKSLQVHFFLDISRHLDILKTFLSI